MPGKTATASSPTSCNARKRRCSPHPDGSPTDPQKIARAICAAGPSTSRAIPTALRRSISTIVTGEFPRIDDRRAGQAQQPWLVRLRQPRSADIHGALSGIVHVDGRGISPRPLSAAGRRHHLGAGVRRARGKLTPRRATAGCWRWPGGRSENRSDLAVFNATDVAAGPVALVHLGASGARRISRQLGRRRRESQRERHSGASRSDEPGIQRL